MKLFCRHNSVYIQRAHRSAWPERHGKEAWIDENRVYNYVVCSGCGKVLQTNNSVQATMSGRIYGEAEELAPVLRDEECTRDHGEYDENAPLPARLRWHVPKSSRHGSTFLEDDLLAAAEALK